MSTPRKAPARPVLEEKYRIPRASGSVSIDRLVEEVLSCSQQSPLLRTGTARQVDSFLSPELPTAGVPLQTAIDELIGSAGTYYRKNAHPGMFAYVASPGLPTDPLAHALTAALNQNVTGYANAPGATVVERHIIRWMCKLAGLPDGSDGLVVSGGSVSNLSALATAVYHTLGPGAREGGIQNGPRPVILAAQSAHFSIQRAAVLLGIGRSGVEPVGLDSTYHMDVGSLKEKLRAISEDPRRAACCVVATAGTTAMGVVDPLAEIAEVCHQYGVWLHVDAAYGGAALLSSALRDRLKGTERADSITIDLHKWCYLSFDGSILLYRDPSAARELYAFEAGYARYGHDQAPESHSFFDLSPEVSRRNRALQAYLAWRHYGFDLLGRNVQHNADCAQYLATLVEAAPDLQPVGKAELSICCFRYLPPLLRGQDDRIDVLNERIVDALSRSGDFLLSPTLVNGRPVLRVCICSHATVAQHMDALVAEVRRIGNELMSPAIPESGRQWQPSH